MRWPFVAVNLLASFVHCLIWTTVVKSFTFVVENVILKALYCTVGLSTDWMWYSHCEDDCSSFTLGKRRYSGTVNSGSLCACVHIYACMYDVLVFTRNGEEGWRREWLAENRRRTWGESWLVLHQIIYGGTGMYRSWHIWAWVLCGCKQRGGYWLLTPQWFWDWYIDKVFSVAVIKFVAQVLVSSESFTLLHSCTSNMHVKLSMYVCPCPCPCNLTLYLPSLSLPP